MDIIETIEGKGGLKAHIYQDPEPTSPREDDNLGRIAVVWSAPLVIAYSIGAGIGTWAGEDNLPDDLESWADCERHIREERGAVVVLPVFLYNHGGMAISTESFIGLAQHAERDSGAYSQYLSGERIGFIYATRKAVLKEYGGVNVTKSTLAKVEALLRGEIEAYSQYLSGDVYGYRVIKKCACSVCGNEHEDEQGALWGIYGIEEVRKQAMEAIESQED